MTAIQDPYPETLDDVPSFADLAEANIDPDTPAAEDYRVTDSALVAAVNRLATAVEQLVLATLDGRNAPQSPQSRGLAPLPPVQQAAVTVVPGAPPCPFHGPEKVAPSKLGSGGFYCQAKPGVGQPNTNPRGYCTWHT